MGISRGKSGLWGFFLGLPSNLKVIIARYGVMQFVWSLNQYGSIYIVALGASGTELGILNSVSLAMSSLFAFLTGWISDRRDRKRIFLIGASVGSLVPIIYTIAPNWIWVLPAFIFAGFADGVVQPAFTAIYANSVGDERRGTVYGLVNVFATAPSLFAGILGGVIVSYFGGLSVQGIRPLYIIQSVLLVMVVVLVWRYLESEQRVSDGGRLSLKQMFEDYREVLSIRGARNWAIIKSLGSVSIGMAGPFWMLYAAEFKGASAMILAYMVSTRGLTNVVFSPLIGRLTDTIGRKKMIIGGRVLMYFATGLMLLSNADWLLILAWVIMGASDSTGIAWQAEEVELVHRDQRSRMTALSVGSFNLLAVPASILGGYLWDNVSPIAPFVVMAIIDGFIRMPAIYFRIPEGKHPINNTRV